VLSLQIVHMLRSTMAFEPSAEKIGLTGSPARMRCCVTRGVGGARCRRHRARIARRLAGRRRLALQRMLIKGGLALRPDGHARRPPRLNAGDNRWLL